MRENKMQSTPAAEGDMVTWGNPAEDPALHPIYASARARADRDQPDVDTTPSALLPEFVQVLELTQQRLRSLQAYAQRAAAPHVERVLAAQGPTPEDPVAAASREARANAAEHAVETLTEQLRIALHAQRAYAEQSLALLDATVRRHHRHACWLTYEVPAVVVPEDLFDAGLSRLPASAQDEKHRHPLAG